jgi:predicted metal-dependent peptidase
MQIHEKDPDFIKLPEGGLWDIKYRGWSVRDIYDDIKKQNPQRGRESGGKGGKGEDEYIEVNGRKVKGDTLDEHDFESAKKLTDKEAKEIEGKVEQALRQGGILAGRLGAKIPRAIEELLEPKIDWRDVLREFITSAVMGKDEYTWRKFNKRMVANDLYLPSLENDTMGELVIAIDTSGSIGGRQLTEFATELASICNSCSPDKIRVLWWDTQVHGEQIFRDDYSSIAKLLKPQGGGGTTVSCVNDYIKKESINAEAVLVFTDGYVEDNIRWEVSCPTMWMVTENRSFTPPTGKVVKYERIG